jgi:hypothetical protein
VNTRPRSTPIQRVAEATFCAVVCVTVGAIQALARHEPLTDAWVFTYVSVGAVIGAIDFRHDFRRKGKR